MRTPIISSIQDLLQKMRQLVNAKDLPNLSVSDLEKYSEEELRAIVAFLQKSMASLGNFYADYAKLLAKFNDEYETGADEIIEGERVLSDERKMKKIKAKILRK